ncbi:MAG: L-histidine N(alpha)-methyltransferase [Burkholderiales bacterium]|nr:MAG: L-histidine N(alpha)-methyltransferase [Burkholderiales bacterium]
MSAGSHSLRATPEARARAPTTPRDVEPRAGGDRRDDDASAFARALSAGLGRRPRSVAPKFFYDAAGSALFDQICALPEYYPTRTELALLAEHASEIAQCIGPGADIVEFGAGSSRKISLLLEALEQPRRFVPIDISGEHLHAAARQLRAEHPALDVHPLVADFTRPFALPHALARNGRGHARRVGFFPGSSIGNFTPDEAHRFLRRAARLLRGGGMLVGVDLVKDPAVLHAAYNDAQGVTAAFNLNLLARANRELGADFAPDRFAHYAFYEPVRQRIEMHLVSLCRQSVTVCGRQFTFEECETLHTENSYKFTVDGFRGLAARSGFLPGPVWRDRDGLFSVHWLQAQVG